MGAGKILRVGGRPLALSFGLEGEQMASAAVGITPADLNGAGARSEDAELRRANSDDRAEITRRLKHVERIGSQDVTELEQLGRLEDHPHRRGGRIGVRRIESEDMLVRAETGDDQVAMVRGGAKDIISVVRRFHPAAAIAQELEFDLVGGTEHLLDGDAQFETLGAVDADRAQCPALHVDSLAPIVERTRHAHRAVGDFGAQGLPEKEMHAAGGQPMT